ncbi:30302_t:CDS:2 [Gigaspora margarita]|uniref:alpha-galactosidase n=1 Tax=Gigaspora margarita TaxID=4874 RepID=A0ABM8VVY1_GIGMA|nr:30302_t:CDS:2 [Gigaspora margarita]
MLPDSMVKHGFLDAYLNIALTLSSDIIVFINLCALEQILSENTSGYLMPDPKALRTTNDIKTNWTSVSTFLEKQRNITKYAGPRGLNDSDMLEIDDGHLTFEKQRSH